jgi:hypothetical protein
MALSIEVAAARSFVLSGKGLRALNDLFQGVTESIGAEIDRQRGLSLQQLISDAESAIEEATDERR